METPKLILLTTTHRVAPGLLSWPAWEALRSAGRVLAADPAHPQLPALRQAGVAVETVERTSAPALARLVGGADFPRLASALVRVSLGEKPVGSPG